MKKQLSLVAAVAAAAGLSATASAGQLSSNTWSTFYDGETITLSANAANLYLSFSGSNPPGTVGSGETLNVTQHFADGCDASGNNCTPLRNYTMTCSSAILGDPGTVSTLRAITNVQGVNQPFVSTTASPACEMTYGARGEVTAGNIRQEQFPHPQLGTIEGHQLWTPPRRTITWYGQSCDSSGISDADSLAAAQAISDAYDTQIASGPIGPGGIADPAELSGTGCTILSITPFSIGYCDPKSPFSGVECQTDLAKAVPVPAFAAGVLGLGLMGITYLTARRRKVS